MQQYILNATAIWLLSLVFFDVLLRKENYHAYNRGYLLFTFLMGALLPLVQWQAESANPTALQQPFERVVNVKQTIVTAATPENTLGWEQWLTIIYVLGVLVTVCLLAADIFKLVLFSRKGNKYADGDWTVIETGREHAPFSFRSTLYVGSKAQYNDEEWNMILTHELQHKKLLHLVDLLLIHAARIVFWFHPLVYVYNKRLLLVHEYQADNAATTQPQIYGRFLIEQAVLHASPSIVHSFNRSPIKNRIIMLTHNSSTSSRIKMLVLLPVFLVAISCFSKNSNLSAQSFVKKGNTVTYKGNTFTLSGPGKRDTMFVVDPVTGEELMQERITDPVPIAMNGKKIYNTDEVTSIPQRYAKDQSVEEYILSKLSFDAFPDGIYRVSLSNIILDDKGKVVFYVYSGLTSKDLKDHELTLPAGLLTKTEKDLHAAIGTAPKMKPASLNGKNVIVNSDISMYEYRIEVNNHVATYTKSFRS